MVRTGTRTPEEVDEAKVPTAEAAGIAVIITITETYCLQNMHLKEKMKDGPISTLLITQTGHRPT